MEGMYESLIEIYGPHSPEVCPSSSPKAASAAAGKKGFRGSHRYQAASEHAVFEQLVVEKSFFLPRPARNVAAFPCLRYGDVSDHRDYPRHRNPLQAPSDVYASLQANILRTEREDMKAASSVFTNAHVYATHPFLSTYPAHRVARAG